MNVKPFFVPEHPDTPSTWSNELGYRLLPGEGPIQHLYSPDDEMIAAIYDDRVSSYVELRRLVQGLEAEGSDYANAAQACRDLADRHFRLVNPSLLKRMWLVYVWRNPRIQWLILVALAIIGIVIALA